MKLLILIVFIFSYNQNVYSNECQKNNNKMAWIWPNAHSKFKELTSESLYLLQGTFFRKNNKFETMGISPYPVPEKKITIVLRLQTLPTKSLLLTNFLEKTRLWNLHNVSVEGIQLDFDSPTLKLNDYSNYLLAFRSLLPKEYNMSITGLADWINNSGKFQKDLKNSQITIFYQLYKEKMAFENAILYLKSLEKYKLPFVVGLLPTQSIPDESLINLAKNNNFKGTICFFGGKNEY